MGGCRPPPQLAHPPSPHTDGLIIWAVEAGGALFFFFLSIFFERNSFSSCVSPPLPFFKPPPHTHAPHAHTTLGVHFVVPTPLRCAAEYAACTPPNNFFVSLLFFSFSFGAPTLHPLLLLCTYSPTSPPTPHLCYGATPPPHRPHHHPSSPW